MFLWRLALDQGFVTPRRLLRCITARELATLYAINSKEPIGHERADWRAAMLGFLQRNPDSHLPFRAFLPPRIDDNAEQSIEDMIANMGLILGNDNAGPAEHTHRSG